MLEYLPQKAIVVNTYEEAIQIAKILLENDYVVLLSREENFWCVNWAYSDNADRNNVILWDREEYEWGEYKEKGED